MSDLKEGTIVDYKLFSSGEPPHGWSIANATIIEVTPKTYILELRNSTSDVYFIRKMRDQVRESRISHDLDVLQTL